MRSLSRVPSGRNALVAQIDLRGPRRRAALHARIATVIETLTSAAVGPTSTRGLLSGLESALIRATSDQIWLALAVVSGQLPDQDAVLRGVRLARLDGPLAALAETLTLPQFPPTIRGREWPPVRVVAGRTLVDLHDTARTQVATGIQRVARQTASRWARDHDVTLIGWTKDDASLRELSAAEQSRALGRDVSGSSADEHPDEIIVPWRCRYLLPELIAEPRRNHRLQSMLRFSGNRGASIAFDLVPLTSAETTAEGMGQGFASSLAAAAYLERVATISHAAALEYRGWQEMLAGTGLRGPQIEPISLAIEAVEPSADALAQARADILIAGRPMVLCVGSHEPRKNHLAVLHAAELLWRDGLSFSLVFVGGNSWRDERFVHRVSELQAAGRPIVSLRALPDDLLWATYRLAHCLVFPSLNEGFGLPVAESLASGTPVVTSGFGSMREIAGQGGAVLVDPRDDHDIATGLRRILTDPGLHDELADQASALPLRTWDEYAAHTWEFLVDGIEQQAAESARR